MHDCSAVRARLLLALLILLLLHVACSREKKQETARNGGGDPARGKEAIERYGCTTCHNIPGIAGPKGMVGPPLDHMASRAYVAGKFPNNPEMMIKWLQNPPAFDPQSAMPNLGITPGDSRDITAYLYTLK
jgi:cytochrome c